MQMGYPLEERFCLKNKSKHAFEKIIKMYENDVVLFDNSVESIDEDDYIDYHGERDFYDMDIKDDKYDISTERLSQLDDFIETIVKEVVDKIKQGNQYITIKFDKNDIITSEVYKTKLSCFTSSGLG
ncbi:9169_t:CDS:1, partial [Cetraspora pellucida]